MSLDFYERFAGKSNYVQIYQLIQNKEKLMWERKEVASDNNNNTACNNNYETVVVR